MKLNRNAVLVTLTLLAYRVEGFSQSGPLQTKKIGEIALAACKEAPDTASNRPSYSAPEQAVALAGLERAWYNTGDGRYFKCIQHEMDGLIAMDAGSNAANMLPGRSLLLLYKVLNKENYYKSAAQLYQRLMNQTPQMTPEALYTILPFCIEYAALIHDQASVQELTRGLLSGSGPSRNWNSRSLAWYGMTLIDALEVCPAGTSGLDSLLGRFVQYAGMVQKVQDPPADAATHSLFVYTLARGVRLGYLPVPFRAIASKEYGAHLKADGNLPGTGDAAPKNAFRTGALLLAASEMDLLPTLALGKGRTVMLDYFFNNEHKKDITGSNIRYHYTWEDQANSGFSLFGNVFRQYGMRTDSLSVSPNANKLQHASIYIIVDPDDEKESPAPNFMNPAAAQKIYDWVRAGGVLVLMSNDSGNAEFHHFNLLPERFGIHFNEDRRNKVIGDQFDMGAFAMTGEEGIFKTTKKIYIKEICTLKLSPPAKSYLADKGDVIIGVAKVGKGTVFAVGDPWFYNEYLDGRKLPAEYDNYDAARDLVKWLIEQIPAK